MDDVTFEDPDLEATRRVFVNQIKHRVAQGRDWVANWEPRPMPKGWK